MIALHHNRKRVHKYLIIPNISLGNQSDLIDEGDLYHEHEHENDAMITNSLLYKIIRSASLKVYDNSGTNCNFASHPFAHNLEERMQFLPSNALHSLLYNILMAFIYCSRESGYNIDNIRVGLNQFATSIDISANISFYLYYLENHLSRLDKNRKSLQYFRASETILPMIKANIEAFHSPKFLTTIRIFLLV